MTHELIPRRPTSMNMNMSMSMSMSSTCLSACFLFLFWAELILIDDMTSVLACMHTHTQINTFLVQFTVLIRSMGVTLRGLVSGRRESHVSPSTPLNLPGVSQSFSLYFSHALLPSHCFPSLHAIARSQTKCCCCCSGKAVHGTSSF